MARKKAVAKGKKKTGTAVTSWKEKYEAYAQQEASRTPVGAGNQLGIRGNVFKFQGADLGDEMNVIVVGHVFVNAYYDKPFDKDNPQPPACFAMSETQDGMIPDESSPDIQNPQCADCELNEFGSGRGRGKACKNMRRAALIHADQISALQDGEEVDIAMLNIPPTSLGNFNQYVGRLARGAKRPSWSVVTHLSFDENEDYEKLQFKVEAQLPDDVMPNLIEKVEEAGEILLTPFDTTGYEKPSGKKAARKKTAKKKAKTKKRSRFSN